MIYTHSLELSLSRTLFRGSKGVRAIEVLLYIGLISYFPFKIFLYISTPEIANY